MASRTKNSLLLPPRRGKRRTPAAVAMAPIDEHQESSALLAANNSISISNDNMVSKSARSVCHPPYLICTHLRWLCLSWLLFGSVHAMAMVMVRVMATATAMVTEIAVLRLRAGGECWWMVLVESTGETWEVSCVGGR